MGQGRPLTDDELLKHKDDPDAVALFTPEETRRLQKLTRRGVDWSQAPNLLATIGGIGGGMVGGPPGALIGAGAGGAAGKVAELYMGGADPLNAGDAAIQAVNEGAWQTLLEAPGHLLGGFNVGQRTSRGLMQSALKPSKDTVEAGRSLGIRTKADVAEAVLNEPRAMPMRGSVDRIQGEIDEINTAIGNVIGDAAQRGTRIDLQRASAPFNEQAQSAMLQTNPDKDLATVNRVQDAFLNHPLAVNGSVAIDDAQRMKVGTYRKMRDQYGELGSAEVEANKAGARGLKDEIANQVPEVAALNLRDSELLLVEKALTDAMNRSGNKDPLGFANASPTTRRFWLALADKSTVVKAALARGVRFAGPKLAWTTPGLTRGITAVWPDGQE